MTKKNSVLVEPKAPSASDQATRYVLVPRPWLVALLVLVLVPWLMVAVYTWLQVSETDQAANGPSSTGQAGDSKRDPGWRKLGPWGQLEYVPIVISPPLEFIPDASGPMQQNRIWLFKNTDPDELTRFLLNSGLSSSQASRLMSTARLVPEIQGLGVIPGDDLILGLPAATRALIYTRLAESEFNVPQRNAYRFHGSSFDEWFGTARLPKETTDLVEPLVYRNRDFIYFSDIDLVTPRLPGVELRRRLMKVLFREATLLIRLRVPQDSDIDRIAAYWGTAGRRMDIRPLLESLGPDQPIDINLLLPVFARRRVYTYRPVTLGDFAKSQQVNCFWTAMNFFNDPPDDRLVDIKTVLDTLKRDYYVVHDNFQLGDVFMFADEKDEYYHAAVYIADDILFTKNGDSILSPFVLVPLDRIEAYYLGVHTSRIDHYRLKRFS